MNEDYKKLYKYFTSTCLILYLVAGVIFLFSHKKVKEEGTISSNINIEIPNVEVASVTSVEYKGNNYEIPDKYMYEVNDDSLIITDSNLWVTNIQIVDDKYDDILDYKDKFKENIEIYNYEVNSVKEIEHNDFKYLIVDLKDDEITHIILYTMKDKNSTYAIELVYEKSDDYLSVMDEIRNILNTCKKESLLDYNVSNSKQSISNLLF